VSDYREDSGAIVLRDADQLRHAMMNLTIHSSSQISTKRSKNGLITNMDQRQLDAAQQ